MATARPNRGPKPSTTGWRAPWRRATRRRWPTIAPRRPMPARPIRPTSISCPFTWPLVRQVLARTDARCIVPSRWQISRWRRTPSTSEALGRVGQRDALVLHELAELAGLVHLADDVAAAHEFALDVELRDGRPLAEFLDALTQFRVDQDVDAVELHAELAQHLDDGGREAALREHRRALHEQQHVVLADLVADALEHLGFAHIDLLKRLEGRGSECNIRPSGPLRHGGQFQGMQDAAHPPAQGAIDHLVLLDLGFAGEGCGNDRGGIMVAVAGQVLDLDLGPGNAFLDQADDVFGGHRHCLVFLGYSVAFI